MSPDRVPALALIELASTVSLSSADSGVSRLAAHNMRVIAIAEKRNSDLVNRAFSDEDRKKRFSIYEQLGDPKVPVIGPWNGFLHSLSTFVSCLLVLFNQAMLILLCCVGQVVWRGRSVSGSSRED